MQDLFTQTKSKKEMLLDWMIENLYTKNWIRTSEILKYGTQNFHNRALRDAQDFCQQGRFRRMTEQEHAFYFSGSKEGVYVRNDFQ